MSGETYTVTRSTSMAVTPEQVFAEVVDFHRWPAWSPWEDLDPGMQRTYSGAESGPGAVHAWSGNRKAGRGTMTFSRATAPTALDIDLVFEKLFKASDITTFAIRADGTGSHVSWSLTGARTLMTRVMGLVKSMDSLIGPDFDKGPSRLKAVVERPVAG